jgi:hypothetical protein
MAFLMEMHYFLFGMTEFLNVVIEFMFFKDKIKYSPQNRVLKNFNPCSIFFM